MKIAIFILPLIFDLLCNILSMNAPLP